MFCGIVSNGIGIKLKLVIMLYGHTKRNSTTPQSAYEKILGAFFNGMRTSMTAKATTLAIMLIFKMVMNNAVIFSSPRLSWLLYVALLLPIVLCPVKRT